MCIADGTEKCKDPENNRPNGVCIMWGCPQAARQSRMKPKNRESVRAFNKKVAETER